MKSSASLRCVRHRKVPELYVGREAPELKRVEGRSVTVKRETTRPMLKLAGSDQNPPLQRQRRKWGYFKKTELEDFISWVYNDEVSRFFVRAAAYATERKICKR